MDTFIDMFCGIGGFRLALERHGLRCVWANDNDKYACQIYRNHWGNGTLVECNIQEVAVSAIPNHNLLTAGFPCQSFSVAGRRGGFEDTRGTMFYEICRIVWGKKPDYLLLENVKGLLNHQKGYTFYRILQILDVMGYDLQWQVLNSKDYGVPQNRQRVFIIGHFRGEPRPEVLPFAENVEGHIRAIIPAYHQGDRIYSTNGLSPTLPTPGGGRHIPQVGVLSLTAGWQRQSIAPSLIYSYYKGLGTRQARSAVMNDDGIRVRRLTPLECERLQGFPDGCT